jgi:hypothetical protein
MGFTTSTKAMPRITTYDEAVATEAKIKPIRGRSVGAKPLGKRSNDNVLIRRDGDRVVVSMYSTDILTYEKDDAGRTEITIFSGGWASQSTAKVIGHILMKHVCIRGGFMWLRVSDEWYALHAETSYKLKVTTTHGHDFTPVGYLPPMVTKVDKKKLDAVRKQYKAFKLYMRRMCKVLAGAGGYITDIPERDTWDRSVGRILASARYEGTGEPDEATLQNFYTGMVDVMDTSAEYMWSYT